MQSYIRPLLWSVSLRATMEFARRVPIEWKAFRATVIDGFTPAAVRPLCHAAMSLLALSRVGILLLGVVSSGS